MKSVLRKFEKNSIDMSKIYGGQTQPISTGEGSVDVDGQRLSGEEYVTEDSRTGCLIPWVKVNGKIYYGLAVC